MTMTLREATDKLNGLVGEGTKLINQIDNEDDSKKVKDFVATLSYYLGMHAGAAEQDIVDARKYRALRKHMFVGKGHPAHPKWIWPDIKIIPFTDYSLDKMITAIATSEGEGLSVYDRP